MNPAKYLAKTTVMIELESGNTLEISLKEDAQGRDCVEVEPHAIGYSLNLTPNQARVLATDLIMAANRAEVRGKFKRSRNVARGAQPIEQRRGLFYQAFAK